MRSRFHGQGTGPAVEGWWAGGAEEEEGLFKAKSDDEGGEIGEDDKDGNWDMPFATDFDMPPQTSDLTWLSLATSTLDSIWNERQA